MNDRRVFVLGCVAAFGAAVVLRLWNLSAQILGGDELHAVRIVLQESIPEILVTYRASDNCIPLSVFYRWWIERGLPLSEMVMRAPALVFGLLAVVLIPLSCRRWVGRGVATVLAWLLASSPLLVLYSRAARPYMPVVLLAFGAVMAFYSWWRTGRRHGAVGYVLLAVLAVFFHPMMAPVVLAPLAFGCVEPFLRSSRIAGAEGGGADPRERPSRLALGLVGIAVLLGLASFLLPAWESLSGLIRVKSGSGRIEWSALLGLLHLFSGAGSAVLALAVWCLAAVGVGALWRCDRHFVLFAGSLVVTQVAAVLVLAPLHLQHTLVLSRYLLPLLPIFLVFLAAGLLAPWAAPAGSPASRWKLGVVTLVVVGTVFTSPVAASAYRRSSFTLHNDFMTFHVPRATLPDAAIPSFYRGDLEPGAVIELPWPTAWRFGRSPYVYQEHHGRDVIVAPRDASLDDRRLAFRNMLFTGRDMLSSRARYLVVHDDLAAEETRLPDTPEASNVFPAREAASLRRYAASRIRDFEARWGDPVHRDGTIRVWDLDRARRTAAGNRAPSSTAELAHRP